MELEDDYKRERGSQSGTETAYSVEARYNNHSPIVIGGQVFDNRWRAVKFDKSPIGVPDEKSFHRHAEEYGLHGYAAAQALRWWLHAAADAERIGGSLCLESRLVKHTISYSQKVVAISAHEVVGRGGQSGQQAA